MQDFSRYELNEMLIAISNYNYLLKENLKKLTPGDSAWLDNSVIISSYESIIVKLRGYTQC